MINYDLDGKVAVITGGASGIGLACAHTMARSGADVSIWDLDTEAVDQTLQSLAQYGHRTHSAIVDVADSARVDRAMDDVVANLGRVDITVCNAGIGGEASISGDYSDQGWNLVIGVNLNGVFFTQRAAIRAMKATGGGSSTWPQSWARSASRRQVRIQRPNTGSWASLSRLPGSTLQTGYASTQSGQASSLPHC